ncbi:Cof-type HAD-IIB family hydrolase [Aureimonas psammosilenae]|uniref:Cof-type HAD-IIB family hydrolase n=1 Tax=Aureimonas psammosilenae TaxID=2495496 RepID=UPI001AEDFEC1|nr:Cof-type HAD-IIB family hydrolase [Aureimonas psammosilenae]
MAPDRMRRPATALGDLRLVVSDIDGTLVKNDKSLAPETVSAVKRLRAAGAGFTLISARPPSGLGGLIEELGLDGPLGAFNGATIFQPDGKIVEAHRLAEDTVRGMLDLYERHGVPVWIFADGRWMTKTRDMAHVAQETIAARQEPLVTPDFEEWLARVDKVQGVCDDPELLGSIEMELKERFDTAATIARSQTYYLDATAPKMDKGTGVRELAKAFGVELGAVAVAGDMPNDLPMFRVAGLAVAMGQAGDDVKVEADVIAKSNDENGLALFLDRISEARADP